MQETGGVIGDIEGSRFEFDNRRSKEFEFFTEGCFATDDSIMTLAAEIKTYLGVLSFRTPQLSEVRYD